MQNEIFVDVNSSVKMATTHYNSKNQGLIKINLVYLLAVFQDSKESDFNFYKITFKEKKAIITFHTDLVESANPSSFYNYVSTNNKKEIPAVYFVGLNSKTLSELSNFDKLLFKIKNFRTIRLEFLVTDNGLPSIEITQVKPNFDYYINKIKRKNDIPDCIKSNIDTKYFIINYLNKLNNKLESLNKKTVKELSYEC